MIVKPEPGYI